VRFIIHRVLQLIQKFLQKFAPVGAKGTHDRQRPQSAPLRNIGGGLKLIQLSQGQVTPVDDHNYEWLNSYKWYARWNKTTKSYYAERKEYLGTVNGKQIRRKLYMHRLILGLKPGECDPITGKRLTGDHENHDTLNNQDDNLRIANHGEQRANTRLQSNNVSGHKGVYRHGKGYQARITVNGKQTYLGNRTDPAEAHALYWAAAQTLHGEFACAG
jgi:hypothetical protein